MKKMFILGLLLVMPLAVRAEVSSSTQAIGAAADAKPQVEESLKLNESIKNATNGFYIEGLEITCTNGKRVYTIMNSAIGSTLTCANGNTNPYYNNVVDGTKGKSIENGSACTANENESTLYATRIYKFDCDYLAGSTDDNKNHIVQPPQQLQQKVETKMVILQKIQVQLITKKQVLKIIL